MPVPLKQSLRIASYILRQKARGNRRYPLVLMLEPLFRCNLACPGCGKVQYPEEILQKRLSAEECVAAAGECGAPVVSIPGGEPLVHPEIDVIVKELIAKKFFVYLCTNAILLERNLGRFSPTPYLSFSVHLDGMGERHDRLVNRPGVFDTAVRAIRAARAAGFRVNTNTTLFAGADPDETADFFDFLMSLGVEGMTVSPGYHYEKAAARENFLDRRRTRELFREVFRRWRKSWKFNQSPLFLDFLAGNRAYRCTPWGSPTRNVFGWQKPCYLLADGHVPTYRELLDTTDWERCGAGRDPRCADCLMHCGYEPSAVNDIFSSPRAMLRAARVTFSPGTLVSSRGILQE
ncbi:MAG: adenosyl-hopene transferase HpnH [Planctomycetota bacterium]